MQTAGTPPISVPRNRCVRGRRYARVRRQSPNTLNGGYTPSALGGSSRRPQGAAALFTQQLPQMPNLAMLTKMLTKKKQLIPSTVLLLLCVMY